MTKLSERCDTCKYFDQVQRRDGYHICRAFSDCDEDDLVLPDMACGYHEPDEHQPREVKQ